MEIGKLQSSFKYCISVAARAYLKRESGKYFFFRDIVQSLFASFVLIYKMKLKLFASYQLIFAFATVRRYGNMIVPLLYE